MGTYMFTLMGYSVGPHGSSKICDLMFFRVHLHGASDRSLYRRKGAGKYKILFAHNHCAVVLLHIVCSESSVRSLVLLEPALVQ